MNARLTALPGGNDRQPGQVSPPSAVMRQYRRQQRTDQQLVNDGIDAMRHVTDLRAQHAQAVAAGHPSALPPYDHTTDPDRPVLPSLVLLALDRVGHFVRVPGGEITRAQAVEALDVVARWARPDLHADDCPPRGIERPVLS